MPSVAPLLEFTKASLVKLAYGIFLFSHVFHLSSKYVIDRQALLVLVTIGYPQKQRLHQVNRVLSVELLFYWIKPRSFRCQILLQAVGNRENCLTCLQWGGLGTRGIQSIGPMADSKNKGEPIAAPGG